MPAEKTKNKKRFMSECSAFPPRPPPAKCGTVVLSVVSDIRECILWGDVAAPPAPAVGWGE